MALTFDPACSPNIHQNALSLQTVVLLPQSELVMYQIIHERPEDAPTIETLLDQCFGKERYRKTAYKVRENTLSIDALNFVAISDGALVASIKYWPLLIDNKTPAVLLGPIAVHPDRQGEGIGVKLIRDTMKKAKDLGHSLIVLVGDPEYYERFGYVSAYDHGLEMPGPVARHRFLVCELTDGALDGVQGVIMGKRANSDDIEAVSGEYS